MARWAAAVVFIALLLAASASASTQRDALIRPAVGIGKVRLGMMLAQVRAAWGRPYAVQITPHQRGARTIELQYDFAAYVVTLVGLPRRERVVAVSTTLAAERLRQGVGVGSLERRLLRVFRGELDCERLPISVDARGVPLGVIYAGAVRRCTLGDRDQRHTVFTSRIHPRWPWDHRPVAEWVKLARVMEVTVRSTGTE
jgi:hypothetical protein